MTPTTESSPQIQESLVRAKHLRLCLNLGVVSWDHCLFVRFRADQKKDVEVLHGARGDAPRMPGYAGESRFELNLLWRSGKVIGWPVYPQRLEGRFEFSALESKDVPSCVLVDVGSGRTWRYRNPNGLLIPPWIVPAQHGMVRDHLRLPVTVTGKIKGYSCWPLWRSEWARCEPTEQALALTVGGNLLRAIQDTV